MSGGVVAEQPAPLAKSRVRAAGANLRQAYVLTLTGALGALFGLYLYVECVRCDSVYLRDMLAGLLIGGSMGFFLNAQGPLRDGAWLKLAHAVTLGVPAAALGGAIGLVMGEVVIGIIRGGLLGRALSWAVLGLGIGLGQGIADRSRDRLVFGLIGGGLGGFVGGLLFEWLRVAMGHRHGLGQSAGIIVLGGGLGLCLALVEQTLRRAWVQVLNGRQEGRIYLVSHPLCRLGLDERADVGIFGDPLVSRCQAEIDAVGRGYRLRDLAGKGTTRLNGEALVRERELRDGDRIELGRTLMVFRQR